MTAGLLWHALLCFVAGMLLEDILYWVRWKRDQ